MNRGFSIVEALVALALVALGMLVASSPQMFMPRMLTQEQESMEILFTLEKSILSALERPENFITPSRRMILQDGGSLPQFEIEDANQKRFTVPRTALAENQINPSVVFYDKDGGVCAGGASNANCVAKVELSMLQIAGRSSQSAAQVPDWIRNSPDLRSRARFPIYGVAYRLTSLKTVQNRTLTRGVPGTGNFRVADHTVPLPIGNYLGIRNQSTCEPEDILAGIDQDTGNAICLKPVDVGCTGTSLAKQIRVENGQIYVDCVEYKSIVCPPNYLVQSFSPALLDGADPVRKKAGTCAFVGAPAKNYASNDRTRVTLTCGQFYHVTASSCQIVNEQSRDCSYTDPVTLITTTTPPNRGRAVYEVLGTDNYVCRMERPSSYCNGPYDGGFWDGEVRFAATCGLKPDTPSVVDMYGE